MTNRYDRRDILKGVGAVCAAHFLWPHDTEAPQQNPRQVAGRPVEVQIAPVSAHTFRLSVLPVESGQPQPVKRNGSLVQDSWGPTLARFTGGEPEHTVKSGELRVRLSSDPLQAVVENAKGDTVQQLTIDSETGAVSFLLGNSARFS